MISFLIFELQSVICKIEGVGLISKSLPPLTMPLFSLSSRLGFLDGLSCTVSVDISPGPDFPLCKMRNDNPFNIQMEGFLRLSW